MRRLAGYDTGLVLAALLLVAASVFVLLTSDITDATGHVTRSFGIRQAVFALLGLGGAVAISRVNLERLQDLWPVLYGGAVLSIVAVFFVGSVANGAKRWIDLGVFQFQPSEPGKLLVILALSAFVVARLREIDSPRLFALVLLMAAIPALMVFKQPDFGTSQIYGYVALAVLFFAGARWLHFALLGGAVVAIAVLIVGVLPAAGVEVLHEFQMKRLTSFLDPESDLTETGYQARQAKIAVGSGQLTGKRSGEKSQVQQAFLPEPQTDFVFATLTERRGFVGAAVVLLLYMLLISRCLRAVAVAPTMYGRLVCGGVAMLFGAQVVTNVGMVIGLMPVTGVPLPLVSYGGSAMLANLAAIGLVAGVLRSAEAAPTRYARRVSAGRAVTPAGSLPRRRSRPRARL